MECAREFMGRPRRFWRTVAPDTERYVDKVLVYVPGSIPPPRLRELDSLYSFAHIVQRAGAPHPHPALYVERQVMREFVLQQLLPTTHGTIADIGGNPKATLDTRQVHVMAPRVDDDDVGRHGDERKIDYRLSVCRHRIHECRCHQFTGGYAIHVYDVGPKEYRDFLSRCRPHPRDERTAVVYVVVHHFPEVSGRILDEAAYTRLAGGRVRMDAEGNYTTSAMDWLTSPSSTHHWVDPDEPDSPALAWRAAQNLPGSTCYKLWLTEPQLNKVAHAIARPFVDTLNDNRHYGSVSRHAPGADAMTEQVATVYARVGEVYSVGQIGRASCRERV